MARINSKVAGKKRGRTSAPIKMGAVRCSRLIYRFNVALEKFDIDAFRKAVRADEKSKHEFHVVNTRDPKTSDYHAHLDWSVREKEIAIKIDYVEGAMKPLPDERESFSDNLMQWIGQFFKYKDANARIHSDFSFDAKKSALSWFPLPMRTKISTLMGEAILDGISVSLPSQPDVSRFFLSRVKDVIFVAIQSERRIKFSSFSLGKELKSERAFTDKLIEVQA